MMYLRSRQNIVIQIARSQPMDLGMVGFVDDSNGQTNDFMHFKTDTTLRTTLHQLRHNAQAWSDILGASGGALELSKCSCHLLNWNFSARGDPVLASTRQSLQQPIEVVVDPLTQDTQVLNFLPPHTAHKPSAISRNRRVHNKNSSDNCVKKC